MPTDHSRRRFIADLGKGVFAVAIFGVGAAACSTSSSTTTAAAATTLGAATSSPPTTQGSTAGASPTEPPPTAGAATVGRVSLGFVSAYVLARGSDAAVVDTGVEGSAGAIAAVLSELGLTWSAVGHVILTHLHGDHVGSLGAVMAAADGAAGYAGAADLSALSSPRLLTAVGDGDAVFGLDIVATPGHTPGHISVLDPVGRALVAGDAINGAGSGLDAPTGVAGPNPRFTPDMDTAVASVHKLTTRDIDAIYFGHGEPLIGGAGAALEGLAAQL